MNRKFRKLVNETRKGLLLDVLQLYGDLKLTPVLAMDIDWLHVVMSGVTDAAECMRITDPDQQEYRRRKLRRELSLIVAACEEWEKRI